MESGAGREMPAGSPPTGTVSFLFTDIEESTRLAESLGDEAYAELLKKQAGLISTSAQSHSGYEVGQEGDSFFITFSRATDAVAAALDAQRALYAHNWPKGFEMRVRFGIHTGEAQVSSDGYIGLAVHRAQRICKAANGGQILLSATTKDLVHAVLPVGASLKDLGAHRLKDLGHPEQFFQVVHPDLPSEFPALQTLDVLPNNLPVQLTTFIGREGEIEEVKRLLTSVRLVTLVGPGGSGKTRLALQVAAELLEAYQDGAWLVDLAATTDESVIPQTVASILGVRGTAPGAMGPRGVEVEGQGRSVIDKVLDRLRTAKALVILDNCEHLVAECAALAEEILRSCPQITVFATSREPLGIPGEARWRIPPLAIPDSYDDVQQIGAFEAVRLFVDRAVLNQSDFRLTEENAQVLLEIAQRLDGMPLAIELAAAWVSMLSPKQILSRLDDQFRLLAAGHRRGLPRHQTLRATVDWSYDLLSVPERKLLEDLSIFGGGFSLEAAERVCAGEGVRQDVLQLLSQLVDKSLVIRESEGGAVRYRLLETIRQYGWEKVSTSAGPLEPPQITTAEPVVILRREGEYWTVGFEGDEFRLKGSKGLVYIQLLIANPGQEFHVLDVAVRAEGSDSRFRDTQELPSLDAGDAGEILDAKARAQYKVRLQELKEELEEARSWNDPERIAVATKEMDLLTQQLAGAVGLGGRSRRAGSASERARMSVGKAIRSAIKKIDQQSPALGRYLESTINTGTYVSYQPDPTRTLQWSLGVPHKPQSTRKVQGTDG
ncbi:MAG: AAA family ATPase [Actinobacteria bacterium]|nr:AAA family ATPase [Actinomycetota bacterium]